MEFNPENKVVQLCAQGMEQEGKGQPEEAARLFNEAWAIAATDFERFTAAHYVARHQKSVWNKLLWDLKALSHALKIEEEGIKASLASLYLNVAKCYEDLDDFGNAKINYQLALSFVDFLPNDGFGNMIRSGIARGLERVEGR
ncbi:rRNA adenine methyltransferase [Niastella yeongjuensis]|uniref:rRNA adenine methyltransferase n=1 Tax=Niastella yeongjuensis TaxID=354355 RepID=A0A1V9EFB8_9BACT|nr:rRNA adenine methyltransferase [Niastella yeongjuensis]OQP44762.1 rRNA adenine methyltransferase [Niastella yeongjuensis]SEP42634.1 rifampin ADP-ribosylating transferase [Niastella yeongjuensis]